MKRKSGQATALAVMSGLVAAIHVAPPRIGRRLAREMAPGQLASVVGLGDVEDRDKSGHDGFAAEVAA